MRKVNAISNTDDQLRNHGFILTSLGWVLSPAYDLTHPKIKMGWHSIPAQITLHWIIIWQKV